RRNNYFQVKFLLRVLAGGALTSKEALLALLTRRPTKRAGDRFPNSLDVVGAAPRVSARINQKVLYVTNVVTRPQTKMVTRSASGSKARFPRRALHADNPHNQSPTMNGVAPTMPTVTNRSRKLLCRDLAVQKNLPPSRRPSS